MPYLSARALGGLKQYEYKSGGYTRLDDLHQPFWNCTPLSISNFSDALLLLLNTASFVVDFKV